MAMTKCNECGGQMSTRAWACPHCGARVRSNKGAVLVAAIFGLLMAALGMYLAIEAHPPIPTAQP